ITTYVPISYGKANDIAKLLTTGSMQSSGGAGGGAGAGGGQHGFLSPRGSVSFDQRTNTLLINDTAEKIEQLRKLIAVLDRPVQQVLIESRVVIASDSFERDLGAQFGISGVRQVGNKSVITGGSIPTVTGNPSEYFSNAPGTTYQTNGLNVSLPASTVAGSIGVGIIGKNFALDLELQAAQTEGRSELVSSPRVITANQQEAVIRQGQEIGYVTYQNSGTGAAGSGTATVAFKDAVLELKVTPTITADNRVYLAINVKKDALASYITVPGSGQVPIINTQEVNTSVLIDNGQTVVLGGIYQVTKTNSVVKVPGLGDIPVLGALFRQTSRINDKAELLIFLTPRILNDSLQ
ncbi:MAG: type IV pilus secretin PilQ, partial [Rhodanobacter sp.]